MQLQVTHAKIQKSCGKIKYKIKKEGMEIFKNKNVVKRLHINGDNICFITMTDDKETLKKKQA